jgi:hypothetical protein
VYQLVGTANAHVSMNIYAVQPGTAQHDRFVNVFNTRIFLITQIDVRLDCARLFQNRVAICDLLIDVASVFNSAEICLRDFSLYSVAHNGGEYLPRHHRRLRGPGPHPFLHLSLRN